MAQHAVRAKSRYIPSLDGLRAFAVLSVIAYHMGFSWAPGGLLGVTVFFVLSGYLITGLLIAEFRSTKTIDLPNFWLRRIRRLVPAIVFVLIVVAALCVIFNHVLLTKMRDDILPSLFFFSNWWQIIHNVSYFQAIGSPSPLQHFWSLGIEEQFYLIWPVVLLFLFKRKTKGTTLRRGILILAALSAIEMAVLYSPDIDPSRVYYGTDTRAFSLLLGAWLAFVWPSSRLSEESGRAMTPATRAGFNAAGIAALIGLVLMVGFANGFSPFLYRGGLVICSILTAIVIAVIVHPISLLGKALGTKPLVWIGKRSYGMYLWHYPILLLMTDRNSTTGINIWWCLLELAIVFGISAFSYTFIENPIRHGALEDWVRNVRNGSVNVRDYLMGHILPAAGAAAVTLVAVVGCFAVPPEAGIKGIEELQQAAANQDAAPQVETVTKAPVVKTYSPVMIGDSVSVHTIPVFHKVFPDGLIDSAVNRQLGAGDALYKQYRDAGAVGDVVIFALGTNGVVTDAQMNELMADVGTEKKVYLVNTRSPLDWVPTTNAALASAAARFPNVTLVDWYSLSANQDDWFDGDGTHLTDVGAVAYMQMICNAMGYTAIQPTINDFYTDNGNGYITSDAYQPDTLESITDDSATTEGTETPTTDETTSAESGA